MAKRKPKATDAELAVIIAGSTFRNTLLERADGRDGLNFPWWYGWAIVQAFQAGAKWQREQTPPAERAGG